VSRCTGGQTLRSLLFRAGFPTIAIYVGDHDASVWCVCARARVFERANVARTYVFAGVSRCESTERVLRSAAIGMTGCLNTLTGSRGALARLSRSGAHSDIPRNLEVLVAVLEGQHRVLNPGGGLNR